MQQRNLQLAAISPALTVLRETTKLGGRAEGVVSDCVADCVDGVKSGLSRVN